ncbi:Nucleolar Rna Helicase 2 [Manis pentadactyla]|nr:Nucleolar Rna Helicase 2 [Manis pentadactyla]
MTSGADKPKEMEFYPPSGPSEEDEKQGDVTICVAQWPLESKDGAASDFPIRAESISCPRKRCISARGWRGWPHPEPATLSLTSKWNLARRRDVFPTLLHHSVMRKQPADTFFPCYPEGAALWNS